jgi:hypothetical protein
VSHGVGEVTAQLLFRNNGKHREDYKGSRALQTIGM